MMGARIFTAPPKMRGLFCSVPRILIPIHRPDALGWRHLRKTGYLPKQKTKN